MKRTTFGMTFEWGGMIFEGVTSRTPMPRVLRVLSAQADRESPHHEPPDHNAQVPLTV